MAAETSHLPQSVAMGISIGKAQALQFFWEVRCVVLDDEHGSYKSQTICRLYMENFCEIRTDDSTSEPPLGWPAILECYKPWKVCIYDDTIPIIGDTMDYWIEGKAKRCLESIIGVETNVCIGTFDIPRHRFVSLAPICTLHPKSRVLESVRLYRQVEQPFDSDEHPPSVILRCCLVLPHQREPQVWRKMEWSAQGLVGRRSLVEEMNRSSLLL